jgi:glycosyltransferase involved in cell wall biosynthesis
LVFCDIITEKAMELRSKILVALYKLFPFPLKGNAAIHDVNPAYDISCVINFYGRIHLLEGILYSLSEQDLPKEKFEVLLVEDRGGTEDGREIARRFDNSLNIRYSSLSENFGVMGYSRNLGLSKSQGAYVLFLDDDTVILRKDFLSTLIRVFKSSGADAVIPHGTASYGILKGKYDFHDPFFPTNRCMAYSRDVLQELGGFVSEIIGQEDVEFVVRFIASGKSFHNASDLEYYHPPFIMSNLRKAAAVGLSFTQLKKRYPFIIWMMLLINGSRYLPLLLFPIKQKWRMQGKFSMGFLLGILYAAVGANAGYSET